MVKTRAAKRRSVSRKRSMQRSYRRHMKKSSCRGKGPAVCRATKGCRYASGKKRSYCRKGKGSSTRSNRVVMSRADKFLKSMGM